MNANLNKVTVRRPSVVVTIAEDEALLDEVADAVFDALRGLGFSDESIKSTGFRR